jgi:transcriptional regulator with XRE-family HTH domain
MDAGLFGSRLRELREAAGMSQGQLGSRLKPAVRQNTVSQWERGDREPTLAVVVQLAELFGIGLTEFVEPARKPPRGRKKK